MDDLSPEAAQQIRNALRDLRAHDGYHTFEDLCCHFARLTIDSRILPQTGPVGAGGDQKRDFESFRSVRARSSDTPDSVQLAATVGQCTLQTGDLDKKIKSDVQGIVSGEPVSLICYFIEQDMPPARVHHYQAWARREHNVALDIFDGHRLASALSKHTLYAMASNYLPLPPWQSLHGGNSWSQPGSSTMPRQAVPANALPRGPRRLIGREAEVGQALQWLAGDESDEAAPQIVVISGPPGAGKTALAVSVARAASPAFPDGHVWIDGSSTGPDGHGAELLPLLLTFLGDDPALISPNRAEQMMRLRMLLASRRVLIVLDDLNDEDMLRGLASVSGSFALLVTSRYRLTGLASEGARYLDAGPLPEDNTVQLALSIADRLTEEEARRLAAICGGLAIAVCIAASLIARRPKLDVSGYLSQIASVDHGIDELKAGRASVEAIIEQSYRLLTPEQDRVMQVLGVLPNASIPGNVVSGALADDAPTLTPETDRHTARILDDLHELNLVEEPDTGRYQLHAILYQFARRRSATRDRAWRQQVIGNACLAYTARIETAANSIGYADPDARVPLDTNASSIQTLHQDRPGAVMMTSAAARAELWNHAADLAHVLIPALDHLCHWRDVERLFRVVGEAGKHTGNSRWQTESLLNLGICAARAGCSDEAAEMFRQCAKVASETDDFFTATAAHNSYGDLLLNLGHADEALPVLRRTLRAWRLTGNDAMLVHTMHSMGMAWLGKARMDRAESFFRNALRVAENRSIVHMLPAQGIALATVLRLTGRMDEARKESGIALERARAVGDKQAEASALREVGLQFEGPCADNPFTTALEIYRELGDTRGELYTLAALGVSAQDAGRDQEAAQWFDECMELAVKTGDSYHIAICLGHMAIGNSKIGQHDEAEKLISLAEKIAEETGHNRLLAQVRNYRVELLYKTGHTHQAIPLLQRTTQSLTTAGESTALAKTQVQLGYALMANGRWKEAHPTLRAVAEAPSDAVGVSAKASAWTVLSALYSRRGLINEALDANSRALALVRETGSPNEELQCLMASATTLARADKWAAAAAEYERALAIAIDLHDTSTLVIILANQASCWRKMGDTDKAMRAMHAGISHASRVGAAEIEASLRFNLGDATADQGDLSRAITELSKARAIAATLQNNELRAKIAIRLAYAYRDEGSIDKSRALASEARKLFQSIESPDDAAMALALELEEEELLACLSAAVRGSRQPDQRVSPDIASALSVMARNLVKRSEGPEKDRAPSARNVKIHVADEVRSELEKFDVDIDDVLQQAADERRSCYACRLPIAPDGQAEALLVQSDSGGVMELLTLTHPGCVPSSIARTTSSIPQASLVRLDIECTILNTGIPAIVVDCRGQRVFDGGNHRGDPFLSQLELMGFVPALKAVSPEAQLEFVSPGSSSLRARLAAGRLTISAGSQTAISNVPLRFFPQWYRATRSGALVAMFGRNLQGMSHDDPSYLINAVNSGNVVAAAMPLTVVPPGRNERCVCTSPTNRKFKHCCGRPISRIP